MPTKTTTCECGVEFTYEVRGPKPCTVCEACKKLKIKASALRIRTLMKVPDDQLTAGSRHSGAFQARVRTREEVADELAKWEFWNEVAKRAADPEAQVPEFKPMTAQRIDQIEKIAMAKIRTRLLPFYREWVEEREGEGEGVKSESSTYVRRSTPVAVSPRVSRERHATAEPSLQVL